MQMTQMHRFPTTRWSLFDRLSDGSLDERKAAMAELIALYSGPIRMLVASRYGVREHEADDIFQDFITLKWIEQDFASKAHPEKGRFRRFLAVAVRHFVHNWVRSASHRHQRLDDLEGFEPDADHQPIGAEFDRAWALQVVEQALHRTRQYCIGIGREDLWAVLDERVVKPALDQKPPTEYADLVTRFGFVSPTQASNALVTAKRTFERALREVVILYEGDGDPKRIDDEVADLLRLLRGGRR